MNPVFETRRILAIGVGTAVATVLLWTAAATVTSAQPAGPPGPRPDHRSEWQRESDWIWRSSRKNQHFRHADQPGPHSGTPWFGSGLAPYSAFGWSGSWGPFMPPMYDPGFRYGQQAGPPAHGGPGGQMPPPQVDAPPAQSGPVDPGSRRYVNRWQRSGRGYIHVFGWEWTSNGVKQQDLHRVFVDRTELADPMALESVPAAPPNDAVETPGHRSGAVKDGHTDGWFKSLDADGDGAVSRDEFRKAVQAVEKSGFPG